ncbi:Uncharacterized protein dnm_056710 [Desulfonema magnum]|uniref:Uncharacterized protein n=1 Tax=Desulfonema magnum TaxID=45655 RepID=A0A975BQC4_9BACT|nr:Uncharacterized protein dnm_056710 [Desulfonema magnum]
MLSVKRNKTKNFKKIIRINQTEKTRISELRELQTNKIP